MSHKLPNYLRTYRKRNSLTQDEMAFLLGCKSGTKVSRYEHFKRQPSIKTAFRYSVVFNTPSEDIFSGIYQETESEILKRVKLLVNKLDSDESDRKTIAKIEFLRAILEKSDKNL